MGLILLVSLQAKAADRQAQYYTIDTTAPITNFRLEEACNEDANNAEKKLADVSTRLTGNPTALQVVGYYGQVPTDPTTPINQNPPSFTYESYCYLVYTSYTSAVGFESGDAVRFTHLSSANWETACKPVYDQVIADPNTLIADYEESASLFQGRICDVPMVKAVKLTGTQTPQQAR